MIENELIHPVLLREREDKIPVSTEVLRTFHETIFVEGFFPSLSDSIDSLLWEPLQNAKHALWTTDPLVIH